MKPATAPRGPHAERLLYVDPGQKSLFDAHMSDLPTLLQRGDVLVVNDAATLPAAFRLLELDAELRLVARGESDQLWRALLFGAGDFGIPTELRPEPPRVRPGDRLKLDAELDAVVTAVDAESERLIQLRFSLSGFKLWRALFRLGRPIQYAYVPKPLELWDVQNRFAARPWALELPSAGHPLTGELLSGLRRNGVEVVSLTHAAGISSTGSAELDRRLPFPERYEIPEATRTAIMKARADGARVVAVGTTVVRALESSAAKDGVAHAGAGEARLVIRPGFRPRLVDGLLTGMHEPGTSHFALLEAFAERGLLERALAHAEQNGYLAHEFGDACLVLRSRPALVRHAA